MNNELNIVADPANYDKVTGFVEEFLEGVGCDMAMITTICIATEEIFVNIAHYAYETEGGGDATIQISFDESSHKVSISFIDSGEAFDPLAKPDLDLEAYHKARRVGGLGIFMVKKSMDDMTYERKDEKNILTIVKTI